MLGSAREGELAEARPRERLLGDLAKRRDGHVRPADVVEIEQHGLGVLQLLEIRFTLDRLEFQCLTGQVQFEKAIRGGRMIRSPDDVEPCATPLPHQSCQPAKRLCGSRSSRSREHGLVLDRRQWFEFKVIRQLHVSLSHG